MKVAGPLHLLGLCAHEGKRPGEAEGYFRRVLEIEAAKPGHGDQETALTLYELGR